MSPARWIQVALQALNALWRNREECLVKPIQEARERWEASYPLQGWVRIPFLCARCGDSLEYGDRFCGRCGTAVPQA